MLTNLGCAWIAMVVALGLHVLDEAKHDFLATYNPVALRIRSRLRGVPFPPVYTFRGWLAGLIAAVAALALLTPFAFAARPWLATVAFVCAVIQLANGTMHLVASAWLRRAVPGVLTAPLLLSTGAWLLFAVEASRGP